MPSQDSLEHTPARIAGVIEDYDAQGWHRTGSPADAASADWLASLARDAGATTTQEPFTLRRLEPRAAFLQCQGATVEGLPVFDAVLPEGVIDGSLGPVGSEADIGLVLLADPSDEQRFEDARAGHAHRAFVVVSGASRPGLQARNAPRFNAPFGLPALQVSSEFGPRLSQAAAGRTEVRLVIDATYEPAESSNVVAIVEGAQGGSNPVVVTTPRTGWWHCAGERGGGIAAWLEVIRSMADAPGARDVLFIAFAGHELGHLGLNAALERRPAHARGAHVWVHFGANVGAAQGPAVRVSASTAADLERAAKALSKAGVDDIARAAPGVVNGLEPRQLNALGARCVSLVGGNDLFHLESDRWPEAVDVEQVAKQARGFCDLIRQLADD